MRERSLGEARRALETIAARDPARTRSARRRCWTSPGSRSPTATAPRRAGRSTGCRRRCAIPPLTETAAHLRCRAQRSGGDEGCDAAAAPPATR